MPIARCLVLALGLWALWAGACPLARAKGSVPEAEPAGPQGRYHVTWRDNRVFLEAYKAPVRDILAEIGRLTGVEVEVDPRVDRTYSGSFQGESLEEAVKRVAGNWAMVFFDEAGHSRVAKVVVPGGAGRKGSQWSVPGSQKLGGDNPAGSVHTDPKTGVGPLGSRLHPYVPGELLVRFKSDVPAARVKALLLDKGISVRRTNPRSGYTALSLPEGLCVFEAARWCASQGLTVFAEPNAVLRVQCEPGDPGYPDQWALYRISAEAGWAIETGRPGVVMAVIDTGLDLNHPDLEANIWRNSLEISGNGLDDDGNGYVDDDQGWDFVENASDCADGEDCDGRDNDPTDRQGHGTHVAGIAGAVTGNGLGIAGVAWHCKIMVLRAGYKATDGHGSLEVDDAADAIRYAVDNGADVLNLSWGGDKDHTLVREALEYANAHGVIVCAAAGNNHSDVPFYPAAYPAALILAVGATDQLDQKAGSSNYGPWVDVSAPGVEILSTCLSGGTCTKSGTSMATPHVAGLTALLLSRFTGWSPAVMTDILLDSVRLVDGLQGDNATAGIIDLGNAMNVDSDRLAAFVGLMAPAFGRSDCADGSESCEGDLDADGDVDGLDLAGLAGYSEVPATASCDP
ncbi:MAG: S8 family serine peptidase [Deltaproteobacteria bacterium]|nr:S8 family serine peptidase [Deltaproteobacteria bacterium]